MRRSVALVPAALLLAVGIDGLYTSARGSRQVTVTCDEFIRARPSSLNVRIEGCDIDAAAGTYRVSGGRVEELFFPARLPGAPTTRPVHIVVATTEPAAVEAAQPVSSPDGRTTREGSVALMRRAVAAAGGPVITGTIRAGLLSRLRGSRSPATLGTPLAPDAVVIDQHVSPAWGWPIAATAAGIALLAPVVVPSMHRRRAAPPAPEPQATFVRDRLRSYTEPLLGQSPESPTTPLTAVHTAPPLIVPVAEPPGPPRVESGEMGSAVAAAGADPAPLPAMMLLNLGADATLEDVESAPPLGAQDQIVTRLRAVIPSLGSDAAGRLVTSAADHSLTCDLGPHGIVHTVIVQVKGRRGLELLGSVIHATGWRAFVPKLGRFATPAELAPRA